MVHFNCLFKILFMKPNSKLMVVKSLLVISCVGLFSFSNNRGGDSFEIWLNGKMMLQQFVHVSSAVQTLRFNAVSANDKLDIYYRHCGQVGSDRYITIKDENDRTLKVWKFPDASGNNPAMSIKLKDIAGLKKGKDSKLNIFYSSKELPKGKVLATLAVTNETSVAMK
jgi:hypothetical protein